MLWQIILVKGKYPPAFNFHLGTQVQERWYMSPSSPVCESENPAFVALSFPGDVDSLEFLRIQGSGLGGSG